uniref:GCS light chain n=1 Tax=Glossina brevipalpis TaxID=37001 RepID=A0A1A9WHU6_9MUSC
MNKNSKECVKEAANALRAILDVDHVDNLVPTYHPKISACPDASAATLQCQSVHRWGNVNKSNYLNELKELWFCLEDFVLQKQINQLGIADLDTEALKLLCQSTRVKPTIAQINLAVCCVVPPPLKEFCPQHDVQLLTHSDPDVLLADENFILPNYTVDRSLRYQVHVRCRGVLTAKGCRLSATKSCPNDKVKEPNCAQNISFQDFVKHPKKYVIFLLSVIKEIQHSLPAPGALLSQGNREGPTKMMGDTYGSVKRYNWVLGRRNLETEVEFTLECCACCVKTLLQGEIVMSRGQLIMSYRHTGIQTHSQELLVIILPVIISIRKCRKRSIYTYLTFDVYDCTKVLDRLREFNQMLSSTVEKVTESVLRSLLRLAEYPANADPMVIEGLKLMLSWWYGNAAKAHAS